MTKTTDQCVKASKDQLAKLQEAKALEDQLEKLQDALEIGNENGLLKNDSATYDKITEYVAEARKDLDNNSPNTIEARKKFSSAYYEFNQSLNSSSRFWRFTYYFGGFVMLYFSSALIALFWVWISFPSILLELNILLVPARAYLWGCVGGILQGSWWLWQHVSDRSLRKCWFVWYVLFPFIGAILGALAYLIFVSGFIAATGEVELKSESFTMLLSALAGFSSRWAVQVLNKLTTVIHMREKGELF